MRARARGWPREATAGRHIRVAKPVRRALRLAAAWLALLLGPLACPAAGQPASVLPSAASLETSHRPASLWERHHDVLLPSAVAIGLLALAATLLGIILVRARRTEAALKARTAQLEALQAVGTEIPRELDVDRLLDLILRRAAELVRAPAGVFVLWDEEEQRLRPGVRFGEAFAGLPRRSVGLGEGLVGLVAAERAGRIVNAYRAWSGARSDTLAHTPITASLAEPLLYRDRLVGVLNVVRTAGQEAFTEADQHILRLFADQAVIAIENARMHAGAQARQAEMGALLGAMQALSASLDLDATLERIVRQAAAMAQVPVVRLFLLDPVAQVLRCRVGVGLPEDVFQAPVIPVGASLSGHVAATGEPLAVADTRLDPRSAHADYQARYGLISYLGLPVQADGRTLGVLILNTTTPHTYTAAEIALYQALAQQAALALTHAQLYAAAQQELAARQAAEAALALRAQQLEALRAIGAEITRELDATRVLELILARAMDLLATTSGAVFLWDEAGQVLIPRAHVGLGEWYGAVRRSLGEGVVGAVARDRVGLIVNDYPHSPYVVKGLQRRTGIQRALCEPLLCRDALIGALIVRDKRDGSPFTASDLELLRLFASQAAIAIENARLHTAAVRRGAELEALLTAARAVMAETDLPAILRRITTEAATISGCDHVKLLLADEEAGVLRVGALMGISLPADFTIRIGLGPSGRVAASGRPLFVEDPTADPENVLAAANRALGVVTYLGLPIRGRSRLLGVLTFSTISPRQYPPEEIAYLASFADQAALAIEQAQMITELQRSFTELQRTQAELIRSAQLRGLGQMAAGIAHDLNNTLATVLGQVEVARYAILPPEMQEVLEAIEIAASDGAATVRRIQDFARTRGRSPLRPCDLAAIVRESIEITRPRWKDAPQRRGVTIQVVVALADVPLIQGYAPEVREALTNLIFNAVDAMPLGGTLTFAARVSGGAGECSAVRPLDGTLNPEPPNGRAAEPPNPSECVDLTVTDTGTGMPPGVQAKIFEPFFTTKGVQGSGLGLSVVYGIMERHGGSIAVASEPGRGATFTLRFQRAAETTAAPVRPASSLPCPAPQRLLVVDDEAGVRRTLARLLTLAGHAVAEAPDGRSALSALAAAPVDLVITDLGMPDLNGWELARRIKTEHAGVPVILLTGWQDQAQGDEGERRHVDAVFGKPVKLPELLRAIERVRRSP